MEKLGHEHCSMIGNILPLQPTICCPNNLPNHIWEILHNLSEMVVLGQLILHNPFARLPLNNSKDNYFISKPKLPHSFSPLTITPFPY
jgi:hypothetical protein